MSSSAMVPPMWSPVSGSPFIWASSRNPTRSSRGVSRWLDGGPRRGPDGRPRGVDPGDEQQCDGPADVVAGQRLAVHLGVEQEPDEVVAGVLPVVVDDLVQVVVEGVLVLEVGGQPG